MLAFFTFSLTFAVSLTLGADVVAKHSSKDEVLFGRKLIQRTGDKQTDGIEALLATKIDVDILLASGLHHVVDSRYYLINDSKRFPEVHIILCHNSPLPAESFQSCFYISHHVLMLLSGLDLFPDFGRQIPFGTGTSISYNYIDYRIKNETTNTYQLRLCTDDEYLCGELRDMEPQPHQPRQGHVRPTQFLRNTSQYTTH